MTVWVAVPVRVEVLVKVWLTLPLKVGVPVPVDVMVTVHDEETVHVQSEVLLRLGVKETDSVDVLVSVVVRVPVKERGGVLVADGVDVHVGVTLKLLVKCWVTDSVGVRVPDCEKDATTVGVHDKVEVSLLVCVIDGVMLCISVGLDVKVGVEQAVREEL